VFSSAQEWSMFLSSPQISCLKTQIQDTKSDVTVFPNLQNISIFSSNFASNVLYTLSLLCFDDENNENIRLSDHVVSFSYISMSSSFFEVPNIDLSPCSVSSPFLRVMSVQRSCDENCEECMNYCTNGVAVKTLWENENNETVAMILQLKDTSTTQVSHLDTSSTITIQGYGFQNSTNYDIDFASVLEYSNTTCNSVSLSSMTSCRSSLCDNTTMICSVCAPYTAECSRYDILLLYIIATLFTRTHTHTYTNEQLRASYNIC